MQKSELQLLVDDFVLFCFVLFCFSFSFPSNCFHICCVIPDYYIPVCDIWWGLPQCTFISKANLIFILVLLALLQISIKLRGGGPFSLFPCSSGIDELEKRLAALRNP